MGVEAGGGEERREDRRKRRQGLTASLHSWGDGHFTRDQESEGVRVAPPPPPPAPPLQSRLIGCVACGECHHLRRSKEARCFRWPNIESPPLFLSLSPSPSSISSTTDFSSRLSCHGSLLAPVA